METIGRIILIPRGNYNSSTVYNRLDWVRSGGKAWVCKIDGTQNVFPVEGENWTIIAQDGSSDVDWDSLGNKPFDDIDNDTLKVDPTTHELYVDNISSELSELNDVNITSPIDKQVLTWDNTTQKWINKMGSSADLTLTAAEWEAYTDEQKAALEDETTINITDDYLPDMVMTTAEWEERKDTIGDDIMVTITDDENTPSYISDDFKTTNGVLELSDDVASAIDDIANKADRDQITSASDVWVTPHTGGYKVGDIVIHNNTIYECITAQAQGSEVSPTAASGSTYWTASSVLSALKSSLAKTSTTLSSKGVTYSFVKVGKICELSVTSGAVNQAIAKNAVLVTIPNGFKAHLVTEATIFDGATGNAMGRVLLPANSQDMQVGIAIPIDTYIRFSMTYIAAD